MRQRGVFDPGGTTWQWLWGGAHALGPLKRNHQCRLGVCWKRGLLGPLAAAVQPQQSPGGPEGAMRRRRWETDDITPQRTVKLCSVYCKHKWIFIFSFLA